MKKFAFILIIALLSSCVSGGLVEPRGVGNGEDESTRGWISVTVKGNNTEEPSHDDIEHLRLIIFKNVHSRPIVEQNLTKSFSRTDRAAKLEMVVQVAHHSGETGKLVVAIANEPTFYTPQLATIESLDELNALEFDMKYFVHTNHLQLLNEQTLMPMSGALWTPHIYDTKAEAEAEAKLERSLMQLKRAVARVDVFMTSDLGHNLELRDGSFVTLHNTFDKTTFVHDITELSEIGRIQTVAGGFISKKWSIPGQSGGGGEPQLPGNVGSATTVPVADTVPVCSFYTPERLCLSNKLELEVGGVFDGDSGVKGGRLVLNTIAPLGGTPQPFTVVERNNAYKVVVTVRATGITGKVQEWNPTEVEVEL